MKTFLKILAIFIIVAGIILGVWGYIMGQDFKRQGQELQELTEGTLNLEPITAHQENLPITIWQDYVNRSSNIYEKIENYPALQADIQLKIKEFYGAKANDKFGEIKYLQFLNNFQKELDLKNNTPKSKGQIETILENFDTLKNSATTENLSLGPDYNSYIESLDKESTDFKESLNTMQANMTADSPATQLRVADLDKTIDELKLAITESLNDWIDQQNIIQEEINKLAQTSWVMPL